MSALPESQSADACADGPAQNMVQNAAGRGGHGVWGELRGLPPEGEHCLISVVVNVQSVVTFLNFFCSYCA